MCVVESKFRKLGFNGKKFALKIDSRFVYFWLRLVSHEIMFLIFIRLTTGNPKYEAIVDIS